MTLYFLQRLTAAILAPMLLVHLAVIIYAVRGGLSAAEILGRTQGSLGWTIYYGAFVLVVAVHGAIGLRNILDEMTPLSGRLLNILIMAFAVTLLGLGFRAVAAVT